MFLQEEFLNENTIKRTDKKVLYRNHTKLFQMSVGATRRVLYKNVFLKIPQRPATLLKKRLWRRLNFVNSVNFEEFFLQNTSGRRLLQFNRPT